MADEHRDVSDDTAELLVGSESPRARAGRLALIDQLREAGVSRRDIEAAVSEDRLALLPVELVLAGAPRYTVGEVAARAELPVELFNAHLLALGLPNPDPEAKIFDDDDVDMARALKAFQKAGLGDAGVLEISRTVAHSMNTVSEAIRRLIGEAVLQAGDTEVDLGMRYARVAEEFQPLMGPMLAHQFRVQLRQGLRRDMIGQAERASGLLPGATEITVAFADLVGFTRLGEELPAEDLGRIANRLAELVADTAGGPVRLVKTLGDGAMMVSREPAALVETLLDLVEATEAEGDEFPELRAGVASGLALGRSGDWYGKPVNIASRVTTVARPGSVLVTEEVKEAVGEDAFDWSRAGRKRLKNVDGRVALHRAKRRDGD